jgi:hypothetical protein
MAPYLRLNSGLEASSFALGTPYYGARLVQKDS